ncbi:MAG TPA: group II intron reverse transcriptase/maturase [Thermodesulfobacteriota bacterium]|nr:group II intron reverse transcriptase/maturase [Thermodesulfobacteriota bacterium]
MVEDGTRRRWNIISRDDCGTEGETAVDRALIVPMKCRSINTWREGGQENKYEKYREFSEMSFDSVDKTKQETEAAHSRPREDKWNWVERTIWTDRMLMALDNGVKGNKWFSLIDKVYKLATLKQAWQNAKANKGAAGIDQITIDRFSRNASKYLEEIATEITQGRFKPSQIRRTYIPKSNGKKRPLGIPTVKDRIVQGAIKMVLEPIWEREFLDTSHGFRPKRGAYGAIQEVSRHIGEGYTFVVDADIEGYYDNIPQDRLMQIVATKIADVRILRLVEGFLTAGIVEEMKEWIPTKGTPQGSVLSPLLANIYLHPLDVLMKQRGYRMVRYADDFMILCKSEQEAQKAKEEVQQWMTENGLKLHQGKTRICNCAIEGQGFDFLGFRFDQKYKFVRKSSKEKLKEKIREKTKRTAGKRVSEVIKSLNKILIGWFNYFKIAQGKIHRETDQFIRRRLRAILRKQEKRGGMGYTRDDCDRWPNEYFAKLGLFSLEAARAQWRMANQSR